ADQPAWQSVGKLSGRAQSLPPSRASGVRAVSQTADQFHRALEGENAMAAMGADVQWLPAVRTGRLLHIQYHTVKRRVFRPAETHGLPLASLGRSCSPEKACLALYRPVVLQSSGGLQGEFNSSCTARSPAGVGSRPAGWSAPHAARGPGRGGPTAPRR